MKALPQSRPPARGPSLLPMLAVWGLCAACAAGCRTRPDAGPETAPATLPRTDTARTYLGRAIAPPMPHAGAEWFERPDRAATEFPDRVLDALDLHDTMRVADVGAASGYFTFRLAPRLRRGTVYAIDIDPAMQAVLERRRDSLRLGNVRTVLGSVEDPGLDSASVDVALIVDSYHEFSHPQAMGRALVRALRPGGRLVLVEYRAEDPTVTVDPAHKMTEAQMRAEMAALGLRLVGRHDVLPQQHLLVFGR